MAKEVDVSKLYSIGQNYMMGTNGKKINLKKATKYFTIAADAGHVDAACNAGACYYQLKKYKKAVSYYQMAADKNNTNAIFNLGICYMNGNGITQSDSEANKLFRYAAKRNNALIKNSVGEIYFNSQGILRDVDFAFTLFKEAAKGNVAKAESNMAKYYCRLDDYDNAQKYFDLASKHGYTDFMNNADYLKMTSLRSQYNYRKSISNYNSYEDKKKVDYKAPVPNKEDNENYPQNEIIVVRHKDVHLKKAFDFYNKKEYEEAICEIIEAIKDGSAGAEMLLGGLYYNGNGVPRNANIGMELYIRSASHGCKAAFERVKRKLSVTTIDEAWAKLKRDSANDIAYNRLDRYDKYLPCNTVFVYNKDLDERIPINTEPKRYYYKSPIKKIEMKLSDKDIEYLTGASNKGDSNAMYKLALYKLSKDKLEEAFKLFERSAKEKNVNGMNGLGYCYDTGQGVKKSYFDAMHWYSKAADLGYAIAQYNLALGYDDGEDNDERELTLDPYQYTSNNKKKNNKGRYTNGNCCVEIEVYKKNRKLAMYWYELSAKNGCEKAKAKLSEFSVGEGCMIKD